MCARPCRAVPGDALARCLPQLACLRAVSLDGMQEEVDDSVLAALATAPSLEDVSLRYRAMIIVGGLKEVHVNGFGRVCKSASGIAAWLPCDRTAFDTAVFRWSRHLSSCHLFFPFRFVHVMRWF